MSDIWLQFIFFTGKFNYILLIIKMHNEVTAPILSLSESSECASHNNPFHIKQSLLLFIFCRKLEKKKMEKNDPKKPLNTLFEC